MVMRWSWGEMSPQELQHMADLIEQDLRNLLAGGLDMRLLKTLSGLGSKGSSPQHCHRDLLTRLPTPKLGTMSTFKIYLEHSVFGVSEAMSGIVWPHELFANLYHHHNAAFFTYMVPSLEILKNFWGQVRGEPPPLHLTLKLSDRLSYYTYMCSSYSGNEISGAVCLGLSKYLYTRIRLILHNTYPASGGEGGRFSSSTK